MIGVAGGAIGGFFGVGGGIVMVPLILYFLKPERKIAHATSLGAITLLAVSGVIAASGVDNVDWGVGVAVGIGGIVGATIGATWLDRLSPRTLRMVFAVVLIVAGLRMLF